jgi:glycerophosphoryl diester phosphodiesterase
VSPWPRPRPGHPYLAGRPIFAAHRGGAGLAPENTMEAFRNAVVNWGVDMLELDVRLTRDGVLVIHHDETVDRTTNGSGRLADLTWDKLQELDAGHQFRDPEGQASYRGKGVTVPTFQELLEAFPEVRLNVEAKEQAAAVPLVDLILEAGAQDRVLVAAEFERNRKPVIGYPGAWGASRLQVGAFLFLLATPIGPFYTPACDVLQVPERASGITVVTPRFLKEAHRRNIPVHVWAVDDPMAMRKLVSWGVDGIQTDRPDLLAPILTEMVGRPPAPCLLEGPGAERGSHGLPL